MLVISIPLTLLMLFIYVYWIWKKHPISFSLSLIFLIEIVWGVISIVWIDSGVYISEQLRYSYTTGAALRYMILMAPFAIIFPIRLDRLCSRNNQYKFLFKLGNISLKNVQWGLSIAVALYLFIDLVVSGTPLLTASISKGNYYSVYSKFPFANSLHKLILPFCMLMFGIQFAKSKKHEAKHSVSLIMAALTMLIQLLLDNKFYGLYDYLIWFSTPIVLEYVKKKKQDSRKLNIPWKYILIVALLVGVLLGICYSQYARRYTDPLTALLNRIFSLQSHTFWGVDLAVQEGSLGLDLVQMWKELVAGLSGVSSLDSNYGIARVMFYVTTNQFASDLLSTGIRFSGSFLTVSLSYSGYILTFIFSVVMAFVVADSAYKLKYSIENGDYILLFFCFFIYRRMYEFFRVGSLSTILSWKFLIVYLIIYALFKICIRSRIRDHEVFSRVEIA